MKIENIDKKFLIDMLNETCSIYEYGKKTGISHIDHLNIQKRLSEYIGIDIKGIILKNKKNRELKEKEDFLNKIFVCDNCGKEYRNGDRLRENKSGRHFCSDLCSKQFSQKHVDVKKISLSRQRQIQQLKNKYYEESHPCPICGGEIPFERRHRKTCSNECSLKSKSINVSKALKGTGKAGGYHEKSSRGKYGYYKGIFCASTYELAFLIYCLDHKITIERNLKGYEYVWNGEKHIYYPDWLVNKDHLVETKNFITELVLEKAKAVNDYPIEILDFKKLIPYFDYVAKTYNKKYYGKRNNFYELYDE